MVALKVLSRMEAPRRRRLQWEVEDAVHEDDDDDDMGAASFDPASKTGHARGFRCPSIGRNSSVSNSYCCKSTGSGCCRARTRPSHASQSSWPC